MTSSAAPRVRAGSMPGSGTKGAVGPLRTRWPWGVVTLALVAMAAVGWSATRWYPAACVTAECRSAAPERLESHWAGLALLAGLALVAAGLAVRARAPAKRVGAARAETSSRAASWSAVTPGREWISSRTRSARAVRLSEVMSLSVAEAGRPQLLIASRHGDIILFHHVLGLTDGVRRIADALRHRGHTVHTPDLFGGRTFPTLDDGFAHVRSVGFDVVAQRGVDAVSDLPSRAVFAGLSLGVVPAQRLLQTTPDARGGLFIHAFIDPDELDGSLPDGIPVQVHAMDRDPFFVDGGDLEAARTAQREHPDLEVHTYPGTGHLFTEAGHPDHDEAATRAVLDRAEAMLAPIDGGRT